MNMKYGTQKIYSTGKQHTYIHNCPKTNREIGLWVFYCLVNRGIITFLCHFLLADLQWCCMILYMS